MINQSSSYCPFCFCCFCCCYCCCCCYWRSSYQLQIPLSLFKLVRSPLVCYSLNGQNKWPVEREALQQKSARSSANHFRVHSNKQLTHKIRVHNRATEQNSRTSNNPAVLSIYQGYSHTHNSSSVVVVVLLIVIQGSSRPSFCVPTTSSYLPAARCCCCVLGAQRHTL